MSKVGVGVSDELFGFTLDESQQFIKVAVRKRTSGQMSGPWSFCSKGSFQNTCFSVYPLRPGSWKASV